MTARPARRLTPGWALVLLGTTLAWAFSYISIDRATTPPASPGTTALDAYQLAFWRNAIAAAVYLPVVAWFATRRGLPPLPAIRANLGLGALQYGIGILCFYWAIAHGNLLINGLLNGLFPVLLAITARLLGDPMDRRAWPWIGLSFLGTAVLVWGNQRSMDIRPGEAVLVPSLVMLAANVLLAFASIRSRHYAERYPSLLVNGLQVYGGMAALGLVMVVGSIPALPSQPLAPGVLGHTLYLALVITFATTWIWLMALTRVPAHQAGMFIYLEPLLVAVLVAVLPPYDDEWTWATWTGGLLILAGAVVVGTLQEGKRHWTQWALRPKTGGPPIPAGPASVDPVLPGQALD